MVSADAILQSLVSPINGAPRCLILSMGSAMHRPENRSSSGSRALAVRAHPICGCRMPRTAPLRMPSDWCSRSGLAARACVSLYLSVWCGLYVVWAVLAGMCHAQQCDSTTGVLVKCARFRMRHVVSPKPSTTAQALRDLGCLSFSCRKLVHAENMIFKPHSGILREKRVKSTFCSATLGTAHITLYPR